MCLSKRCAFLKDLCVCKDLEVCVRERLCSRCNAFVTRDSGGDAGGRANTCVEFVSVATGMSESVLVSFY